MKYILALILSVCLVAAQSWYQIATPTNSLACGVTNINGTVVGYNLRYGTNGALRLFQTTQMPVPFTNFLSTTPYGIVCIQVCPVVQQAGGVVETLPPQTNLFVLWVPSPSVPGGAVGVTVK